MLKANESKRKAFVAEYAALRDEAQRTGARVFFADEAHFRADDGLRGKWVLGGDRHWWTRLAPSTGRRPATTRRCAWRRARWSGWVLRQAQQEGNSNSGTSVAFLKQLRGRHGGRLNVIWDNAPAPFGKLRGGEALRKYLRTPGLNLRLVNLPGYSPDFNPDEAIWGWAREEATGNLCLGTREAVQERVGGFLSGLTNQQDEVRRRCRTVLQSRAEVPLQESQPDSRRPANAHPTLA